MKDERMREKTDLMSSLNCNVPVSASFPAAILASKTEEKLQTIVDVEGVKFGSGEVVIIAGPCAVESEQQLLQTAILARKYGAQVLRGGAFKPRTSPYSFQGLELEGLQLLKMAGLQTGLPFVTEVMDTKQIELVCQYADMLQVGSRNMSNFPLLKEVGQSSKPVLLKRGMNATIEEFVMAAEYILAQGNDQVVMCERGIRTFETAYRNTLDLNAIPMLKSITHLPIIADPSHGTGHRWMVGDMAKAAIAAGSDGLMVEMHHSPEDALCDGTQSLHPERFPKTHERPGSSGSCTGQKVVFAAYGRKLIYTAFLQNSAGFSL
jgi:3-deoxy-7-phosphoheptulonate synthase